VRSLCFRLQTLPALAASDSLAAGAGLNRTPAAPAAQGAMRSHAVRFGWRLEELEYSLRRAHARTPKIHNKKAIREAKSSSSWSAARGISRTENKWRETEELRYSFFVIAQAVYDRHHDGAEMSDPRRCFFLPAGPFSFQAASRPWSFLGRSRRSDCTGFLGE
jgi:hypothetical protein